MSKARWTSEQFKKQGLVETPNGFVKATSLVVGKIDKINIDFDSLPELTPEQFMKRYNEQGIIMYNTPPKGDTFLLPNGQYVDVKYRFVIDPISAPRMSQSDKWKTDPNHTDPKKRQRKPVENYFRFKNRLVSMCEVSDYKLTKTLNIIFVVPFPKSYSAKKMAELDGKPHDQKPDIDNFSKCWMDSLSDNDREVWNLHAIKVWGQQGQIIIF